MTNIDFSPSVFDSDKGDLPQPPARSHRKRLVAISALTLAVIGVAFYMVSTRLAPYSPHSSRLENLPSLHGPDIAIASSRDNSPRAAYPIGEAVGQRGNCTGDEIICIVATASKPADLLRKLIAAIPTDSAKQYRIRLSVTAIDEPAADVASSDSSTP